MQQLSRTRKQTYFLVFHYEFNSGYCNCKSTQFLFAFHARALLLLIAYVFSQKKFRTRKDQIIDFWGKEDKTIWQALEISCLYQGAI